MLSADLHAFWSKLRLMALMLLLLGGAAQAQQAPASVPQQKVDQLIKLLNDPDVRAELAARSASAPAAMMPNMSASSFTVWIDNVRTHLHNVGDAIPMVPAEFARAADTTMAGVDNRSPGRIFLLFLLLVAIGLCAEFGFGYIIRGIHARRTLVVNPTGSSGFHAVGRHLFAELAPLVIFTIASVGLFLMLTWPPLLSQLIVPTLLGLIAARVIIRLSKVLLLPVVNWAAPDQNRLIPMSDAAARFWFVRVIIFSLIFFIGWGADGIMGALDVVWPVRALVVYAVDVVLLAAAIETVWRRPRSESHASRHSGALDWVLSFWLCVLWALSVAGLHLIMLLGIYLILLPAALKIASAIIGTAFTPRDSAVPAESPVYQVLVERGVRAAIIAVAILWPAMIMQVNPTAMTQDAEASRIIRGVLGGIIIILCADIVWQIAKALINHRLARARAAEGSEAEVARSSRLLTLLPILRNFLAVLIAVIAIMMVLSAVGIEVGPLIAGAGIFGVAIGFGSQTLVKDVISGIFYMTDDAFRVGEYIQSGSYKGTVESFSLRSVRLRHHRGPIFTVPFGSLGAVENMSRDWVIDKFMISVSYQTDVAFVKKLVKGVGAQLLEDPELGPIIIETVKMKGVEQFGDYGINLSFGMMTKPGQQSMVRRRALAMIREAFTANGIEFASPTVQVGKDGSAADTIAALATNNAIVAQKKIAGEAAE